MTTDFRPIAQIACEFRFEASHQLSRADWSGAENEAVFGNCCRLHGHSYRLAVTLRGPIDPETGMVVDFKRLKQWVRERVVNRVDHYHLNEVIGGLTTAENILYWIADQLLGSPSAASTPAADLLARIELWETATCCAFLTAADLREYALARKRSAMAVV